MIEDGKIQASLCVIESWEIIDAAPNISLL